MSVSRSPTSVLCFLIIASSLLTPSLALAQARVVYLAVTEDSPAIQIFCLGSWNYDLQFGVAPAYPFMPGEISQFNSVVLPALNQMYSNAGVGNVTFTTTPPGSPAVTVYFQDYNDCGVQGIASGVDTFDKIKSGETVTVFAQTPSFYVMDQLPKVIAHEVGHTFGLRHIRPSGSDDPNHESIMDDRFPDPCQTCSGDRFLDLPFEVDNLIFTETHNPTYHLRRYVGNENPVTLEGNFCPGDYDLPFGESPGTACSFSLGGGSSASGIHGPVSTIFDVKLVLDDSGDAMHVVETFDEIDLSSPFTFTSSFPDHTGFQLIGSSVDGGDPDIWLSTQPDDSGDGASFPPVLGVQNLHLVQLLSGGGVELLSEVSVEGTPELILESSFEQNLRSPTGTEGMVMPPACGVITEIPFDDSALESCVETKAAAEGWVFARDVTNLTCQDMGIVDLTGLEYMHNLNFLDLFNNTIVDISALENLTNLTVLNLNTDIPGGGAIAPLSALAGLTNLYWLGVSNSDVDDLSFLTNLTGLTYLQLQINPAIDDISVVATLTNLVYLDLNGNGLIFPHSAVSGLTSLQFLGIAGDEISDISFIAGLTNLTGVGLQLNQIEDVSALQMMSNLVGVDLNGNLVSDLSVFQNKVLLDSLLLSGNRVTDVTPLLGLTQLSVLWLTGQEWPPGLSCDQQQAIVAALPTTDVQVDGFWDDPDDDPDQGNIDCFP